MTGRDAVDIVPKDSGEVILYTFDFSAKLGPGESLTGSATLTQADAYAGDTTDLVFGTAVVASPDVTVPISGGVPGSLYVVEVLVGTSLGQTLVVAGGLSVS